MKISDLYLFEFELPNNLVFAIQNGVRNIQPYSEMNTQQAFTRFIQDLMIRFLVSFQPTEILIKTIKGENENYSAFKVIITIEELIKIMTQITTGQYFEYETKKRLFETFQSHSNMKELGLSSPIY